MSIFRTKILLASDSSEHAAVAARAAADLCEKTGSWLHVVHAWRPPIPPGYTGRPLPTRHDFWYEHEAGDLLTAQTKRIEAAGGSVEEAHLRRGPTVDGILDLSEELDAGLIVAGRRGLGPLKRLMMGSVSDGLARHASCPVLIVDGGEQAWPPARIVIGEDFSEEARGAAELAATLGRLLGADVQLVSAFPKYPDLPRETRRRPDVPTPEEALRWLERDLDALSEDLAKELGQRPETEVIVGDAAPVIVEAAARGDGPVMVAVGGRNLGTMRRVMLGSVSSDVLRSTDGPVLVYRRPAA
ncbi:MAG TPA: universal stress protein [Rubrobacter sp.]|nr:universal stress protein [Rubrobacter sp.]